MVIDRIDFSIAANPMTISSEHDTSDLNLLRTSSDTIRGGRSMCK